MPTPRIPPDVQSAVDQSFLAKLPSALAAQVVEGGLRIDVDRGSALGGSPAAGIVLDGLLRVFLESPAGRQVTVRYARPGDTLGLVHLFSSETAVQVQALTHVSVWGLIPSRLRALAMENSSLAIAIAEECAARAADAMDELALLSFGSVRQRVARHLLDLAADQQAAGGLVAAVTQQELANACGSVREVVARVLKELHAAGLTAGSEGGIVIVDPAALDAEATGTSKRAVT